jgi:hypothetical protein
MQIARHLLVAFAGKFLLEKLSNMTIHYQSVTTPWIEQGEN